MRSLLRRRAFLSSAGRVAAAAVLGGAAPVLVRKAVAQAAGVTHEELRPGLMLLAGYGGNVVASSDTDAAVVVDSGAPGRTDALAAALHDVAGIERPEVLINTHWHEAHTGGNEQLRGDSTRIIAHENTKLWMSTEFFVRWQDRTYMPRADAALPNETFFSTDPQPIRVAAGRGGLEYGHLANAHTDGDVYVRFPDQNVLVAGGAVAVGEYPIFDFSTGGWIDGLIDATARLLEMTDADTLIVPGRGPVQRRAHLQAQHEMTGTVRERVAEQMRLGKGVDEIVALGITEEFDDEWAHEDTAGTFVSNIYADLAWRGPGGSL